VSVRRPIAATLASVCLFSGACPAAVAAAAAAPTGVAGYSLAGSTVQHELGADSGAAPHALIGGARIARAATARTTSSGALPFTGLQLGLLLAAGLALIGLGIFVRRFGGPRDGRR
jgi:hypothetical protein